MATDTRQTILDAALECFLQDGYEQTTIARILERSSVSNGALFHHFASKEAIAEALYVQGIASFQTGLWEVLRQRPRSLRAAVRGTIAHQLSWIELNSGLARFVYMRGHLDWDSQGAAQVSALNAELSDAFRAWMAPLVERREVRVSSMLLISAIVNGPAHAIARRWLAGQLDDPLTSYAEALADAAWAALRGQPIDTPVSGRPAPARARVTLELLDDDGSVMARARQKLDLTTEPGASLGAATRRETP